MNAQQFIAFGRTYAVAALLACFAVSAVAQTVYYDDFARTGNLNGSTPATTTGGATWSVKEYSTNQWTTDGTKLSAGIYADSAKLSFTPVNGANYRLTVDLTISANGDPARFFAVGFGSASLGNDYYNAGIPWFQFTATKVIKAHHGSGIDTFPVYEGTWGSYSATFRIDYSPNADGLGGTASFFVNDSQVGTTYTYTSAPGINSVFISAADYSSGSFDNFTLAAVPEPSTYAALAGVAALGFAAWRQRKTTAKA